jgi:hypothetical protein
MAIAIVVGLRLIVPLSILRWPLAGALASLVLDAVDVILVDFLARAFGEPLEFGPLYAQIDKWLDTYYLAIEAFIASRWTEALLRRTTLGLFAWRLIGVILFEITAFRPLLIVFPNLFENVYLYLVAARRFAPRLVPRTATQMAIVALALLVPKLIQEWVLHWEELHPWQWFRETFVRPWLGW